jgi:FkbM family methyltransferase
LKKFFKYILSYFNFTVLNNDLIFCSDDPILVVSKILNVDKVKIIVDGGASIGDTSKKFSDIFQNATVHAFEPFPKFFMILKESSKNRKRIIPYSYALSKGSSSEYLNVNASEGTNSLLDSENHQTNPYCELLETKKSIKVETKPLDVLFSNETIDLLKLDLQGGEYNALKGAENLLKHERIKCIICEVMFQKSYKNQRNGSELIMYLNEQGFKIFNFYQNHYHHGELLQSDIIFYHKSISGEIDGLKKMNFLPFSKYLARKRGE